MEEKKKKREKLDDTAASSLRTPQTLLHLTEKVLRRRSCRFSFAQHLAMMSTERRGRYNKIMMR